MIRRPYRRLLSRLQKRFDSLSQSYCQSVYRDQMHISKYWLRLVSALFALHDLPLGEHHRASMDDQAK
jgi:hypothetical protein